MVVIDIHSGRESLCDETAALLDAIVALDAKGSAFMAQAAEHLRARDLPRARDVLGLCAVVMRQSRELASVAAHGIHTLTLLEARIARTENTDTTAP